MSTGNGEYFVCNLPLESGQLRKLSDFADSCVGTPRPAGWIMVCSLSFQNGKLRCMVLPPHIGQQLNKMLVDFLAKYDRDDAGDI